MRNICENPRTTGDYMILRALSLMKITGFDLTVMILIFGILS